MFSVMLHGKFDSVTCKVYSVELTVFCGQESYRQGGWLTDKSSDRRAKIERRVENCKKDLIRIDFCDVTLANKSNYTKK